jgi:hypothetical protein
LPNIVVPQNALVFQIVPPEHRHLFCPPYKVPCTLIVGNPKKSPLKEDG